PATCSSAPAPRSTPSCCPRPSSSSTSTPGTCCWPPPPSPSAARTSRAPSRCTCASPTPRSPPRARARSAAEVTAADGADGPAGAPGARPASGRDPAGGAGSTGRDGASWTLRPATLEDVEEIAFAELELFPDEAWSVFQLAEEIEHPDRRYVVAVEGGAEPTRSADGRTLPGRGGALLGYAGIMLAGDLADLHTIGTRREGEGIGRALLAWCE